MIGFTFLIIIVSIASYTDITSFRIPNWLCMTAVFIGIALQIGKYGLAGTGYSILYCLAGGIPLFLLYLCKGVGAGDVKLFAGLGAIVGIPIIFHLIILSFICAGVISVLLILLRIMKKTQHYSAKILHEVSHSEQPNVLALKKVHHFPFMLAVAPATCILWFLL